MVNKQKESFIPAYSLDDIRHATKQGKLRYDGRKVNADIRNLGYTADDVKQCIFRLTSRQFSKSLDYGNIVYDIYISDYQKNDEASIDQIYLKLRLLENGEIQVCIGSFHLS